MFRALPLLLPLLLFVGSCYRDGWMVELRSRIANHPPSVVTVDPAAMADPDYESFVKKWMSRLEPMEPGPGAFAAFRTLVQPPPGDRHHSVGGRESDETTVVFVDWCKRHTGRVINISRSNNGDFGERLVALLGPEFRPEPHAWTLYCTKEDPIAALMARSSPYKSTTEPVVFTLEHYSARSLRDRESIELKMIAFRAQNSERERQQLEDRRVREEQRRDIAEAPARARRAAGQALIAQGALGEALCSDVVRQPDRNFFGTQSSDVGGEVARIKVFLEAVRGNKIQVRVNDYFWPSVGLPVEGDLRVDDTLYTRGGLIWVDGSAWSTCE